MSFIIFKLILICYAVRVLMLEVVMLAESGVWHKLVLQFKVIKKLHCFKIS